MRKEKFSIGELMEQELQKMQSDVPEDLELAATYLANASEILDDLGFIRESNSILFLLEKIANENDNTEELLNQEINLDDSNKLDLELNDELTFEDES
jgi:hypothetical protein